MIRGKWVEVDRERLGRTLEQFEAIERRAAAEGLSFGEAMRLLAGAGIAGDGDAAAADIDWSETVAGPWLARDAGGAAPPGRLARVDPGRSLHGTLRPYQQAGVQWLHLLARLGLGACLADDMGLGKTIQVLSLLLVLQERGRRPSASRRLLVAPASLLANWAAEIARFAPSLQGDRGPSVGDAGEELKSDGAADLDGRRSRDHQLRLSRARAVARDDARGDWSCSTRRRRSRIPARQADPHGQAAQGRRAHRADRHADREPARRPVVDLRFHQSRAARDRPSSSPPSSSGSPSDATNPYGPLRELVRPYILRRLKTDKSIIADLPDKTEVKAFCPLSRKQAALYQQAVRRSRRPARRRRGHRSAGASCWRFLMRLKQICNHPSQWLGDNAWAEEDSGKFARLREIAEEIAARQEKALVFTQFREMTAPLAAFLGSVFGRPGLVLHGETAVGKRKELVREFQEDDDVPFFVLSLKAGGAGLNLTAASHVIHFDRWWNPAVENQATDRAFRIGQTKNVLVHKFVCRGTVEEKIDQMIEAKQQLAGDFLGGGADAVLTEMKDDELLKLVTLDLAAAMKEG